MNHPTQNGYSNNAESGVSEAEQTLRLIARLSAPEGLEDRVHAGISRRPTQRLQGAKVLEFPGMLHPASGWMRAAAAAAIVFVVAGGGWGVYSRVQPPQAKVIPMPLRVVNSGGFSNAGAMRTPNTLNGPVIPNPAQAAPAQPAAVAPAAKKTVRHAHGTVAVKPAHPATPQPAAQAPR
jgi:hypothetical protein